MTVKEIQAKLDTIEKLSQNNEIKALCDVVRDVVNSAEEKKIGFKVEK